MRQGADIHRSRHCNFSRNCLKCGKVPTSTDPATVNDTILGDQNLVKCLECRDGTVPALRAARGGGWDEMIKQGKWLPEPG